MLIALSSIVIIFLLCYAILIYNHLIRLQNNVSKAWANIRVTLKQRHNELSKLIEATKPYAHYEPDLFKALVDARTHISKAQKSNSVTENGNSETISRKATKEFFLHAENYPDLKANTLYENIQKRTSELEIIIADRREFYNATINKYNIRIASIPDLLIAIPFGFHKKPVFEFTLPGTSPGGKRFAHPNSDARE